MLCNLIYNRGEAEPNKNYIGFYRQACASRGVDFLLLYKEDLDAGITPLPECGFFINRTRDLTLTKTLEQKGLPVFNNSLITYLGNDKLAALHYIEEAGLPILKTSENIEDFDRFPVVMKSIDGHGGTEVFLLQSPEDAVLRQAEAIAARKAATSQNACVSVAPIRWIYQEPADTPGKDLRVYVTGNRITACMLRSSDTDFRSNFCLGGKASVYMLRKNRPSEPLSHVCQKRKMAFPNTGKPLVIAVLIFCSIRDISSSTNWRMLSDHGCSIPIPILMS